MLIAESEPIETQDTNVLRTWQVPDFLPLEDIATLNIGALINEVSYSGRDVSALPENEPQRLYRNLRLRPGRPEQEPRAGMDAAEQRLQITHIFNQDSTLRRSRNNLQQTLSAWISPTGSSTDPADNSFALALQEIAYDHVRQNEELIPRPSGAAQRRRWNERFKEIFVLALMILHSGNHVELRESQAGLIASDLIRAGFLREAIILAQLISDRAEQATLFSNTIRQIGKIPEPFLKLVLEFLTEESDSIANHMILEAFGVNIGEVNGDRILLPNGTHAAVNSLGSNDNLRNRKYRIIFDHLISNYSSDEDLVLILALLLYFQRSFRAIFSYQMWQDDGEYLLFKCLTTEYFVEPYGEQWDGVELNMNDDMPWVYENKQRFFVGYFVRLGQKANKAIPHPQNLRFNTLRAWLEEHTEQIGQSLAIVYPDAHRTFIWGYGQTTEIFFFHVDRGDVRPDPAGGIDHLPADDPVNMRLRSDCDVFASYGARFFRAIGFTTVGYMAIYPQNQPDLVGHAGALLRRNGDYYAVNNKEIAEMGADNKEAALRELRGELLNVFLPPLQQYRLAYQDAGQNGEMQEEFLNDDPSVRREDLEP